MNKNTIILLGAIAVLAIGVGVYLRSTSSNKSFETQSVKEIRTQPTTTVPADDWGDKTGSSKDG